MHDLRLDDLDMAWTSCLKSKVTAFRLMTRREEIQKRYKPELLSSPVHLHGSLAHYHFNTATFQANISQMGICSHHESLLLFVLSENRKPLILTTIDQK